MQLDLLVHLVQLVLPETPGHRDQEVRQVALEIQVTLGQLVRQVPLEPLAQLVPQVQLVVLVLLDLLEEMGHQVELDRLVLLVLRVLLE